MGTTGAKRMPCLRDVFSVQARRRLLQIVKSKVKKILENTGIFGTASSADGIIKSSPRTVVQDAQHAAPRNVELFERFSHRERQVERDMFAAPDEDLYIPDTPDWLKKLGERNGLSKLANTHYLLHGTTHAKLQSIVKLDSHQVRQQGPQPVRVGLYCRRRVQGLAVLRGRPRREHHLVCRVIIGRSHLLRKPSDDAAPEGSIRRVQAGTCKLGCKPGSCTASASGTMRSSCTTTATCTPSSSSATRRPQPPPPKVRHRRRRRRVSGAVGAPWGVHRLGRWCHRAPGGRGFVSGAAATAAS